MPVPAAPPRAGVTIVHAPRVTQALTSVHRHQHAADRVERHVRLERSHATTLVERLLVRRERVERAPAPAPPPAAAQLPPVPRPAAAARAPAPPPSAPPVRTTVLHRIVVAPAAAPIAAVAPPRVGDPFTASLPGAAPAVPPAPAPADVGQLADAVIGVLDQRIVAQRERLGRL
jgi:hypothetical protein